MLMIALTASLGLGGDPAAVDLTIVAATGDHIADGVIVAPGVGGDGPLINALGRVAFLTTFNDATTGLLTDRAGELEIIARTGDPAPGTAGFYQTIPGVGFGGTGGLVWRATFLGDLVDCNNNGFAENDHGLYRDVGRGAELILREDGQLAGVEFDLRAAIIGGVVVSPFSDHYGFIVFTRSGVCPNFSEDLFVLMADRGEGLGPLVIPGDPGPLAETTFGGMAGFLRFDPQAPNEVTFAAELVGPGFHEPNDLALITRTDEGDVILLQENAPVPGAPDLLIGPIFSWMSLRSDVFTWRADVRTTDGAQLFRQAVMRRGPDGTLETIALEDEPAAQVPGATYQFLGFFDPPFTSNIHTFGGADDGSTAFRAAIQGDGVTGDDNEVLYHADADGNVVIIAREDDPAPGFDGDVRFAGSSFDLFDIGFSKPFMNAAGTVIFRSRLTGDGIDEASFGLFRYESATDTVTRLIAPGDVIDVAGPGAPTDVRIVRSVERLGPETTQPASNPLTPAGEFVITVTFTDETSAVVVGALPDATIVGDLDGDGDVGAADLALLLAAWGPCPVRGGCGADLDDDGLVGSGDLATLLANWTL